MHPETYDYIKMLAARQTGQAEPRMTNTVDFVGYMAQARHIRMNLTTGSVAKGDKPGAIAIPASLEKPIIDNGGVVWRNTPVSQMIIDKDEVKGLKIQKDGREEILTADTVICTIPPKYTFSVLPEGAFPADWAKIHAR